MGKQIKAMWNSLSETDLDYIARNNVQILATAAALSNEARLLDSQEVWA